METSGARSKQSADEFSGDLATGVKKTASRSKPSRVSRLLEWLILLVAVALGLVIGLGYFQSAIVQEKSMAPTLNEGDRVLVQKSAYWKSAPRRGDLVLLRDPQGVEGEYLIKRVIGLPGETVEIRRGQVFLNGEPLVEPYLVNPTPRWELTPAVTVLPGQVYVLGDNRRHSDDSRNFGPVSVDCIEGKVILRYYPLSDFGIVR